MQETQEVIFFDKEPNDPNIFKRRMFLPENIKILSFSIEIVEENYQVEFDEYFKDNFWELIA